MLSLVFTNEEAVVSSLQYLSGLGYSDRFDHLCLCFCIENMYKKTPHFQYDCVKTRVLIE